MEFFKTLYYLYALFSPIFLCLCPKCLISVIEVIMLATLQNSSSSNVFQLSYWNVYICSSQSLGGAGWKLLTVILLLEKKHFLESDSVGTSRFQGRMEKENISFLWEMFVYPFLLISHWLWLFGSSWWVANLMDNGKDFHDPGLKGSILSAHCQTEN